MPCAKIIKQRCFPPAPQTVRNEPTVSATCQRLIDLAASQRVDGIVVGIPLRAGDKIWQYYKDSGMARKCRAVANNLAILGQKHGLRVFLVDEAQTSRMASIMLDMEPGKSDASTKIAKQVDAMSATLILYEYFSKPEASRYVNPHKVFADVPPGAKPRSGSSSSGSSGDERSPSPSG